MKKNLLSNSLAQKTIRRKLYDISLLPDLNFNRVILFFVIFILSNFPIGIF